MARINVSDKSWTEFRIEAMRAKRSVADYLGRLVDKEVARVSRRNDRSHGPQPHDPEVPDWEL